MYQKQSKLKVVHVEPGKKAQIVVIDHTLSELQRLVDGHMEPIFPFPERVCLVCNEEGLLRDMEPNRAVFWPDGRLREVILGPFFICATGPEDFESLTDEQAERYRKMYSDPEMIIRTGDSVLVIPVPDKNDITRRKNENRIQGCRAEGE